MLIDGLCVLLCNYVLIRDILVFMILTIVREDYIISN